MTPTFRRRNCLEFIWKYTSYFSIMARGQHILDFSLLRWIPPISHDNQCLLSTHMPTAIQFCRSGSCAHFDVLQNVWRMTSPKRHQCCQAVNLSVHFKTALNTCLLSTPIMDLRLCNFVVNYFEQTKGQKQRYRRHYYYCHSKFKGNYFSCCFDFLSQLSL